MQVQVEDGDVIGRLPVSPIVDGYIFRGWFAGETEVFADTVVEGDMEVTAVLEEVLVTNHKVTFIVNDEVYTEIQVTDGDVIGNSAMPEVPEVDGYIFRGWIDAKGNPVTAQTVVTDDMQVIADMEEIVDSYIVTFIVNGHTYAQIQVADGAVIGNNLPVSPTLDGYQFKGWKDANGDSVLPTTKVEGNMYVYADMVSVPTVEAGEVSALAGDVIRVPVTIANNTGITGLELAIKYNAGVLTLVGVEQGEAMKNDYISQEPAWDSNGLLTIE